MKESTKIEILLREYENTNQKIERFVGNQFFYTHGSLILFGSAAAFIIGQDIYYVQFLPAIFLIVTLGIAYQYQRTSGLQGYKQYLEELINKKADENLISYGHIGVRYMVKGNFLGIINGILYALIFIAMVIWGGSEISENKNLYMGAHFLIALALLIFCYLKTSNFNKTIKNEALFINETKGAVSKIDFTKQKETKTN